MLEDPGATFTRVFVCLCQRVSGSRRSSPLVCIRSQAGVPVSPCSNSPSLSVCAAQRRHCPLSQSLLLFDADEQILSFDGQE